ncbi:hypothetical protein [Listeria immobilis]|uniref:hypothetical protein n=1 Tax=Listeria immobilis TaxID=2713502 RepID=UPI0016271DE8|nr:hypothetical protein [Listeria immobilis]
MDKLSGKKSLTKKESNKLYYSEYLKKTDFMWLYELLKVDEPLDFQRIPIEKRAVFSEFIEDLLFKSSDEWVQTKGPNGNLIDDTGEDKANRKKCSLCNTPNRYIYYIENIFNKQKLNIGSDCINEFGSIANSSKESLQSVKKNAKRQRNLQKLLEEIPKVRTSVEKWNNFIKDLPILISENDIKTYKLLGEKANTFYEEILNSGLKENLIIELKKVIEDGKYEQLKINEKIRTISQREFILTTNQAEWIKSHQPDNFKTVKKYIIESQDSQISLICAPLIAEINFLKEFTQKYNKIAQVDNIKIIELYNEWRRNLISKEQIKFEQELPNIIQIKANKFIFEFVTLKNIRFSVSSSNFIKKLGFLVFPSKKTILDSSDILNLVVDSSLADEDSYEAFCSQIEWTVNKVEKDKRFNFFKVNLQRDYADFRVFINSYTDANGNVEYKYSYVRYKLSSMYNTMKCILIKRNTQLLLEFLENNHVNYFSENQYKADQNEELELYKMNR